MYIALYHFATFCAVQWNDYIDFYERMRAEIVPVLSYFREICVLSEKEFVTFPKIILT